MAISNSDKLANLAFFYKLYLRVKLGQDVSAHSDYDLAILYPEAGIALDSKGNETSAASKDKTRRLMSGEKFIINQDDRTITFVTDNDVTTQTGRVRFSSFKYLTRLVFIQELVKWSQTLADGEEMLLSGLRDIPDTANIEDTARKAGFDVSRVLLLKSRTAFGAFKLEDLSDEEYQRLITATQKTDGYIPKQAAKSLIAVFNSFKVIQDNTAARLRDIPRRDAEATPGLTGTLRTKLDAEYHGMLTENDFKQILGDLLVTVSDIKLPGSYIIPVTAKNKTAIAEKIDDIITEYNKNNISGEVIVHIPVSTGIHFTLLSLKVNRNRKDKTTQITEIEHSDSIGDSRTQETTLQGENYKQFVSGILEGCSSERFALDCKFITVNRNAQGGNLYCGDYTIQEALKKTGKKLGGIAHDKSQDLSNGDKLRAATTALVRARLAQSPIEVVDSPVVIASDFGGQNSCKNFTLAAAEPGSSRTALTKKAPVKKQSALVKFLLLPFVVFDFVVGVLRSVGTKLINVLFGKSSSAKVDQKEKPMVSPPVNKKRAQPKASPATSTRKLITRAAPRISAGGKVDRTDEQIIEIRQRLSKLS